MECSTNICLGKRGWKDLPIFFSSANELFFPPHSPGKHCTTIALSTETQGLRWPAGANSGVRNPPSVAPGCLIHGGVEVWVGVPQGPFIQDLHFKGAHEDCKVILELFTKTTQPVVLFMKDRKNNAVLDRFAFCCLVSVSLSITANSEIYSI
jgi:hypothetical protein